MKTIAALLIVALFLAAPCLAAPTPVTPFTFARITDTHVGYAGANVPQDQAEVDAVNAMTPSPDFAINTGDLVDEGTADQYVVYHQVFGKLRFPLYDCPGNHDVRWAPLGKESFQDAMHEPLYRSFDHNGCHFVLLDSTVLLEHWGHFEASELTWLKNDLKKTGRETPVFLFFHHWIGRDPLMVDNEDEFFDIIKPYNVKIVFCGHGHQNLTWRVNGVQYVMAGALFDGAFDYATVTPQTISLYRERKVNNQVPRLLAVIPTAPTPPAEFHAEIDHVAGATEIHASTSPAGAAFSWQIDNTGPWTPFPIDLSSSASRPAACPIDLSTLTPGSHLVIVRASYPIPADKKEESHEGKVYGADNWFAALPVDVPSTNPKVLWTRKVGGTVQSRLLFQDGTVYVPCFDGKVYALDAKTGRQKWAFQTSGSVYATPQLVQRFLYIASTDHSVYAVDPESGKQVWKAILGGPVFAPVRVGGDGVLCVGAGDSNVYGLDAQSGKRLWTFAAKGFVQAQAAYANNAFFVGAWDNTFYALGARDGALKWSDHIGRSMFYSPSIARPMVYGNRVYVVSDDDTLHAIDQATGQVDWTAHSSLDQNYFGYSAPLFVNDSLKLQDVAGGDRLYIGSLGDAGAVECLDPQTGKNIWTSQTGSVIYDSSCAYGNGRLYVGSVSGDFHCLDCATGKAIWTYHLPAGHLLATAAVDGDTAYIASMSGVVYALKTMGSAPASETAGNPRGRD